MIDKGSEAKFLLDIKYKHKKVPNSDFYQMCAYSLAYPNVRTAFLLYENLEESHESSTIKKNIDSENDDAVEIKRKTSIQLYTKKQSTIERRRKTVEEFYRKNLYEIAKKLLVKWETRTGLNVNELKIKKMKTKWGTCNPEKKRIWLNLELVKSSERCIEYVLVHEMMHLLEEKHSDKFFQLLKNNLPNWKQIKDELNNTPLIQ